MTEISAQNGEKIALFGGSFNPPHEGHVAICAWLINKDHVDRVWIVPCLEHPFGKDLLSFDERFNMCKLAFQGFGKRVEVLDLENRLGGVSYTVRTVEHLKEQFPQVDFSLIVGGDIEAEHKKWRDYDRLKSMVEMHHFGRGAGSHIPDVSATEIRARVEAGQPIDGMVPPSVEVYIATHKLYRSPKTTDLGE